MPKLIHYSVLFIVLGIVLLLAGCSSPAPSGSGGTVQPTASVTTQPVPSIVIVSPQNGATLPAGNVTVTTQVSNFNVVDKQGQPSVVGQGHVHFYMDVTPIPSDPAKPAIPSDPKAAWAHVSGNTYTFVNVPAGMHTFTVQLANNDHTPVIPLATNSIMVTVTGGSATGTPVPASTTPASSGGTTIPSP